MLFMDIHSPVTTSKCGISRTIAGWLTPMMMTTTEAKLRPGYIDPSREAELKVNRRALTAPSTRRDLKRLHVGNIVRMHLIRTVEKEWRQARVKRAIMTEAFEVEADGRCNPRNRQHMRIIAKSTHPCLQNSTVPMLQGGVTPMRRHRRSSPRGPNT